MDCEAVAKRKELVDEHRDKFNYGGVDFADALLYQLLPQLLPEGDPGI